MNHHRVFDTGIRRSWKPEERATNEQLNLVFEIMMQADEIEQRELVMLVADQLPHLKLGTCRASVSAGLLYLHEAGFVEVVQETKPTTWKVVN